MSEDASQAAATAAEGDTSAALNPIFRTAPEPASTGGTQGTATQKPAGRQQPAQGRTAPVGDGDRSPEELLADATADDGDPLTKAQAELEKLRVNARKWEKHAKENAEKAKNFDAYEESQKTEQQKFADRAAAAEARAVEADARYHRTLAAATYDLPVSMIDHLGTGTEDEILARAETFAQAINERAAALAAAQQQATAQQQPRNGNGFGRPVESLRPGALPASDSKPANPNDWFRGMLANSKNR